MSRQLESELGPAPPTAATDIMEHLPNASQMLIETRFPFNLLVSAILWTLFLYISFTQRPDKAANIPALLHQSLSCALSHQSQRLGINLSRLPRPSTISGHP